MENLAGTLVRTSRRRHGLTQNDVEARSGIKQASISDVERLDRDVTLRTVERLVAAAGDQLAVLPTREPTVTEAALSIGQHLNAGRPGRAFRWLIGFHDGLVRTSPAIRVALVVADPPSTGDVRWDALLAGLVEYDLKGLPLPEWVSRNHGLSADWFVDDISPLGERHAIAVETPEPLARRHVFLSALELSSL